MHTPVIEKTITITITPTLNKEGAMRKLLYGFYI